MNKNLIIIICIFITSLFGCTKIEQKIKELKSSLELNNKKIEELEGRIAKLENLTQKINDKVAFNELDKIFKTSIQLDVSILHVSQRIETDVGFFLVVLEDVKPYLDGYKLFLKIGNPYYADFNNSKIQVNWAIAKSDSKDFDFKETEISLKALKQGTWNDIIIVVAPSKPEDLRTLSLSMKIEGSVSLYTK